MKPAIFLDRDGTLIEDKGYIYKIEDLKILPEVIPSLNKLKRIYSFFIITNQSGIAKKYFTENDFWKFNNYLTNILKNKGIEIKRTYFCPHLKDCDCRKPSTKYLEEAVKDFSINKQESWVIGDHPSDIEMGLKAKCKTIYLLTGHGKKHLKEIINNPDLTPTFISRNFSEATERILSYLK